jgi:hypothetical protein
MEAVRSAWIRAGGSLTPLTSAGRRHYLNSPPTCRTQDSPPGGEEEREKEEEWETHSAVRSPIFLGSPTPAAVSLPVGPAWLCMLSPASQA